MIELYTADAVVTDEHDERTELRTALESDHAVHLTEPHWTPISQPTLAGVRSEELPVDDIIAVVEEPSDQQPLHANWHDVVLDAGPYRIHGRMPVLPGFDPGRALTRPGSTFVGLRRARMAIIDRPEAGELERDAVLVNRYNVDRVASDLILGFFFPAARFETLGGASLG